MASIVLRPPTRARCRAGPIAFGPDTDPPVFPAPNSLDEARPVQLRTVCQRWREGRPIGGATNCHSRRLTEVATGKRNEGSGCWRREPNRGRIPGAVSLRQRPEASGFRNLGARAAVVEAVAHAVHFENVYVVGRRSNSALLAGRTCSRGLIGATRCGPGAGCGRGELRFKRRNPLPAGELPERYRLDSLWAQAARRRRRAERDRHAMQSISGVGRPIRTFDHGAGRLALPCGP